MWQVADKGHCFYDAAWEQWRDMIRYSPAPRLRRSRVLSWLRELEGCGTLLDVGCGNGEFLLQVRKALPGLRLDGADLSGKVIEADAASLPGIGFHTLDLNSASLGRRYDIVTCMEVIEHCEDYRAAIARLAAMSERWLFISAPCGPLFEIDRRVGHQRHVSPPEVAAALTRAGFTVTRLESWGFPFFNLYKHLINLAPDRACAAFLSDRGYSPRQKLVATLVYTSFRLCVPFLGYQLFAAAKRNGPAR